MTGCHPNPAISLWINAGDGLNGIDWVVNETVWLQAIRRVHRRPAHATMATIPRRWVLCQPKIDLPLFAAGKRQFHRWDGVNLGGIDADVVDIPAAKAI